MANYRVRLSDGVTLACRSEGAGPPFVWSHGMLVNTALEEAIGFLDWRALAAEHRVVRYDVRGHGASAGTGRAADHEWPRLAEDLLQVLNHLGLDRVAVGGGSYNGTPVSTSWLFDYAPCGALSMGSGSSVVEFVAYVAGTTGSYVAAISHDTTCAT